MQSRIINKGNRTVIEVECGSTGLDRQVAMDAVWASHGLRPGQVPVNFVDPTTTEDDR